MRLMLPIPVYILQFYLVFAALTQLQAGEDLALNGLDPGVPLLHTLGFKVPRLTGARDDEEVKVILL